QSLFARRGSSRKRVPSSSSSSLQVVDSTPRPVAGVSCGAGVDEHTQGSYSSVGSANGRKAASTTELNTTRSVIRSGITCCALPTACQSHFLPFDECVLVG
ncbi:unnamed protein product, partial [Protopolystoma xenopodis]